jgi:GNAT superfamily N-acetyltransferase
MIRYTESLDDVAPGMLSGFFVGWKAPRTPEEHLRILHGSTYVVLALDPGAGCVVGFVTALSDGVQAAFIPLLEVLPDYQGRGIGTELMTRILRRLDGVPAVDLTCNAPLQRFYARFGMTPATAMVLRRY